MILEKPIKEHPYFKNEADGLRNTIYYLDDGELEYQLVIPKEFEIGNHFPIKYQVNKSVPQNEFPDWFSEFYMEINDLYFKMNRIRFLSENKRRSLYNIIWSFSILKEKNEEFYKKLHWIKEKEIVVISSSHKERLLRFQKELEKDNYQLKFINETKDYIYIEIT